MVSTRRSKSSNKRRKLIDVKTISHKSTYFDLNLVESLLCGVCSRKKEVEHKLSRPGWIQQTNHRNKARQNHCEQRWSDAYISAKNCSQSRLHTYYRTCNFIGMTSI